ncbi:hypothetical protein DPMN_177674 [Dreissena polymorpha]|uniref:Uncharacterized protein n=1 Tax=Dreissena polymorpha TaxID=45954 RepID=A0A9D4IKE6_DREPO|nr:hypothetical protein DPMN_177674 [Dreissena polymorpha]
MEFPGPHCQLAGISTEQLTNRSYGKIDQITNGIVLDLCSIHRRTISHLVNFVTF